MVRTEQFISDKRTGWVILALAFISRMVTQLYFFYTGDDRSLQLLASKNLLEGHGLSFAEVFAEDLSTQVYSPVVGWPPGYPVFISILGTLTGDLTVAAIIFDLLSVCILVYISRRILQLSGCSDFHVNCFTLVMGFFLYDFCQMPAPDMSAAAFILWALYMTLSYIKNTKTLSYIIGISLVNFIPAFLRYMFIPVAFVIPLYLLLTGYVNKNRRITTGAILSLTLTAVFVTSLLIFQSSTTGSATFINSPGKGFFPENLLDLYPITIGAFANLPFFYILSGTVGFRYGAFSSIVWITNCILAIILTLHFIKTFLANIYRPLSVAQHFTFIGSVISLLITILLIALSLRYQALVRPYGNWTFVQESRYMAFVAVFLQMIAFICLFRNRIWKNNLLLKITGLIIICLLTIETLHGIYFTGKILLADKTYFHPNKNYILQKEFIKDLVKENDYASHDRIFTSVEKTYLNIAALHGGSVLYSFDSTKKLSSSRPFDMIIVIKNGEQQNYGLLLNNDSTRAIKTIGNLSFYKYSNNLQ